MAAPTKTRLTDEDILAMPSVSTEDAADYLACSKDLLRIGLQSGVFSFGTAVKMSSWVYDIRPRPLVDYNREGRQDIEDRTWEFMMHAFANFIESGNPNDLRPSKRPWRERAPS